MNFYEEVIKRKDDLLDDLQTILRIESTKDLTTKSSTRPMGDNIGKALETMLSISEKAGFETTNHEGMVGYAQYNPSNADDYIGILCHLDVVPATGDWTTPPFEPSIRDGKLFARGAIDDKGPTLAAFYGLKIVKELGLPLKHNVRIIFGTDEESGMSCMKKYTELEKMPLAGFAPDADFPIIHAEKGQINVKLVLQKEAAEETSHPIELLSFQAGEKGNMVPDKAEAVLIGDNESFLQKFIQFAKEKGLEYSYSVEEDQIKLTLFGVSAHGMEPEKGVNAGFELAAFLNQFSLDQRANQFINFINTALYNQFKGEGLGIAFSDEITGPLTVNAGIFNYIYETGEIQLNVRCPVLTNYDKTIDQLTKTIEEHGFTVASLTAKEPHHVPKDSPMIKVLQEVYLEETEQEATLLSTGGATYARFMDNGVAFGALFPGKVMTAHQKDEYIEIEDLLRATAIYAHAIYRLGNL